MKFSFDKAAKPRSKRVWYSQREIAYCYKYRKGKLKRTLKSTKLKRTLKIQSPITSAPNIIRWKT